MSGSLSDPAPMPGLDIDALTVRFGGLLAVDGVSLHAPAGSITGLIGPNGAGKTTTFNACTGVVTPASGSVRLGGRPLDGMSASRRAQCGLGRTFQRMELLDTMTVAANVAMGPEALAAGSHTWSQLLATRRERRELAARAEAAMERCGIRQLAFGYPVELSTGQRRLVELARAVASGFRFLLLDEPSSGLDVHETEQFGSILLGIVAERGIGILLVEHDMALVRRVCTDCYVLDFGRLLHQGPTAEVLGSEVVRAAYLGSEAVA